MSLLQKAQHIAHRFPPRNRSRTQQVKMTKGRLRTDTYLFHFYPQIWGRWTSPLGFSWQPSHFWALQSSSHRFQPSPWPASHRVRLPRPPPTKAKHRNLSFLTGHLFLGIERQQVMWQNSRKQQQQNECRLEVVWGKPCRVTATFLHWHASKIQSVTCTSAQNKPSKTYFCNWQCINSSNRNWFWSDLLQ